MCVYRDNSSSSSSDGLLSYLHTMKVTVEMRARVRFENILHGSLSRRFSDRGIYVCGRGDRQVVNVFSW